MKLEILSDTNSLCEQCVALCCRYVAFQIDKPESMRDFEDIRWFMLHEDIIVFVEEGDWFIQVNRKCTALLPDNRCGVYENRPTICREFSTKACDWHPLDYEYEQLFTEPEQIQAYGKTYVAARRKRKRQATVQKNGVRKTTGPKVARRKRHAPKKRVPFKLLKSA